MKCVQLLLLLTCFYIVNANPLLKADTNWWKDVIVYQIYPKSFKDSDGDGMGDIKGITSKLDYLKDLGVGALWLNPIFKSPQVDSGYDISDFRDIEPMLGTLDDLKELKKECDTRGLKLVLDFVPNHSSEEHDWFKKALANEAPYVDYYVWRPKKGDSPPNNWQSIFGGSAWECGLRKDDPQQCYLHQFAKAQPDLNYRNSKLVDEIKDILRFWIDEVGVDGYRMDAVPFLVEDADFPDEVPFDPKDPTNLNHTYTQHLPETYEIITSFRDVLDETGNKLMMTEAYGTLDQMLGYYGTKQKPAAHFTFNFELISNLNPDNLNAFTFQNLINDWINNMDGWRWPNWVLGNHDQHRVATRLNNNQLVDAWNGLLLLLPGTAVTYMGEELGMEDGYVSWEDTDDPQACNGPQEGYEKRSRDPERTPFQWDDTKNAGFSDTDDKTWLPVADNYKEINVKVQTENKKSHLKFYKKLAFIRRLPEVHSSEFKMLVLGNILVYSRATNNKGCAAAINFDKNHSYVNLSAATNLDGDITIIASSVQSGLKEGEDGSGPLELAPFDTVLICNI